MLTEKTRMIPTTAGGYRVLTVAVLCSRIISGLFGTEATLCHMKLEDLELPVQASVGGSGLTLLASHGRNIIAVKVISGFATSKDQRNKVIIYFTDEEITARVAKAWTRAIRLCSRPATPQKEPF